MQSIFSSKTEKNFVKHTFCPPKGGGQPCEISIQFLTPISDLMPASKAGVWWVSFLACKCSFAIHFLHMIDFSRCSLSFVLA